MGGHAADDRSGQTQEWGDHGGGAQFPHEGPGRQGRQDEAAEGEQHPRHLEGPTDRRTQEQGQEDIPTVQGNSHSPRKSRIDQPGHEFPATPTGQTGAEEEQGPKHHRVASTGPHDGRSHQPLDLLEAMGEFGHQKQGQGGAGQEHQGHVGFPMASAPAGDQGHRRGGDHRQGARQVEGGQGACRRAEEQGQGRGCRGRLGHGSPEKDLFSGHHGHPQEAEQGRRQPRGQPCVRKKRPGSPETHGQTARPKALVRWVVVNSSSTDPA